MCFKLTKAGHHNAGREEIADLKEEVAENV